MLKLHLIAFGLAVSTLGGSGAGYAAEAALERSEEHLSAYQSRVAPFISTYCRHCHNEERERGGLRLDTYSDVAAVARSHDTWEHVLERVQSREMPPRKEKQPGDEERAAAVAWIKAELAYVSCDQPQSPGRVTLRRLNRAEYDNTIRDLFGVELKLSEDFPADDSGYGFDNIGDVLTTSPLLMERYLAAAERVAQAVIVAPEPPEPQVLRYSGAALARGAKPADDDAEDGEHVLASEGEIGARLDFPLDGRYTVRVEAWGSQAGPEPARMALRLDGKTVTTADVTAEENSPQAVTFHFETTKGPHRLGVAFVNDYYQPENADPKLRGDRNLAVVSLELEAPPDTRPRTPTQAHRRLMTCAPGAERDERLACARRILGEVMRRAFRRPVQAEEVARLLPLVDQVLQDGGSFEKGMQLALQGVLVSPHFLFLVEVEPASEKIQADGTYALGDFEIAARLSYFLWSSMPDEPLFELAAKGGLRVESALEEQVRRMLADKRSQALIDHFVGQWLELRKLDEVAPDPTRFPQFDDSLRRAMREESRRFFAHVLREGRGIHEFLLADYTFANERLARHYGMTGVNGDDFRKIALTGDRPGGVLAHAGVLTVTSDPTRTSPVKRGKWVLEQLLGTPPPPPPPDVPPLPEGKEAEVKGSVRQRMELHRARPDCNSCHSRMDPLGFGLENYDATGAWRQRDGDFAVDASGTLPSGESFSGPAELQRLLLARKDQFRRCLAEKLLTYALGRGLEYYDRCAVDEICRRTADRGDRLSVLLAEIVKSRPFRLRSIREPNT